MIADIIAYILAFIINYIRDLDLVPRFIKLFISQSTLNLIL